MDKHPTQGGGGGVEITQLLHPLARHNQYFLKH